MKTFGWLGGWVLLGAWTLLNQWIFTRWFDTSYFGWYLANGSMIGIVTSVVSLAWGDINRHVGLIAAHPLHYLGSYFQLAGLPVYEMGSHLRGGDGRSAPGGAVDRVVASLIAGLVTLAILLWIWVVVPVQYFLYLVCGAPGRVFAGSRVRVAARFEDGTQVRTRLIGPDTKLEDGWWEAGIGGKPVALTGLLSALVLAVVRWLN